MEGRGIMPQDGTTYSNYGEKPHPAGRGFGKAGNILSTQTSAPD
jgi:hypothetical protein